MSNAYGYGYDASAPTTDETAPVEETRDNWEFDLSDDQERSYHMMNWMWGFMHTWTLILGVKIYYTYPWMINNHDYWKQACPSSAVTTAVTGSKTWESSEVYA